ncbi:MAG: hypothetical protein ACWA40_05990 [Planktomarina sp.]
MPKSAAISILFSVAVTALFAIANVNTAPHPTKEAYVQVSIGAFNTAAIVSLLYLLYRTERKSNAYFGKIIRENAATIFAALLITLVSTVYDIIDVLVR